MTSPMPKAALLFTIGLTCVAAVGSATMSFAQTAAETAGITPIVPEQPLSPDDVAKQIASFDPRAVAAAQNYFRQPSVRGALITVTDNLYQQVMTIVEKQNPKLDNAQMTKLEATVGDPLKKRLDFIIQVNTLNVLKTFSTAELVAMDKFYSSSEGQAIQSKMPNVTAQVPGLFKQVMPDYLSEVKAKLKADKVEVSFE